MTAAPGQMNQVHYAVQMLIRAGYTWRAIAAWLDISIGGVDCIRARAEASLGAVVREVADRLATVPDDLDDLWATFGGLAPGGTPAYTRHPSFTQGRRPIPVMIPSWHVEATPVRVSARPEASTAPMVAPMEDVADSAVIARLEAAVERLERLEGPAGGSGTTADDSARIALGWMVWRCVLLLGEHVVAERLEMGVSVVRAMIAGRAPMARSVDETGTAVMALFASVQVVDRMIDDDDIDEVRRLLVMARRAGAAHVVSHQAAGWSA